MRQALCVRQRLDVESLIETFRHPWRQRHLGGGQGRQVQLGGHQGLGLNIHQDFVALLRAKRSSSTLILHQRGAQTSSPSVGLRSPLPEVDWSLDTTMLTNL